MIAVVILAFMALITQVTLSTTWKEWNTYLDNYEGFGMDPWDDPKHESYQEEPCLVIGDTVGEALQQEVPTVDSNSIQINNFNINTSGNGNTTIEINVINSGKRQSN